MRLKLISMHDYNYYFLKEDTRELLVYNIITRVISYWRKDESVFSSMASDVEIKEIYRCVRDTFNKLMKEKYSEV